MLREGNASVMYVCLVSGGGGGHVAITENRTPISIFYCVNPGYTSEALVFSVLRRMRIQFN